LRSTKENNVFYQTVMATGYGIMDVSSGLEVAPGGASFGLAEQIKHYGGARRRLWGAQPKPVPIPKPEPVPIPVKSAPIEKPAEPPPPLFRWSALEAYPPPPTRTLRIDDIQRVVADEYGVSRIDILSRDRLKRIVRPRQVAMFIAKRITQKSLPEIGRRFGGKDHTTVLHALRKIGALEQSDDDTRQRIADVMEKLRGMYPEAFSRATA
jgi:hypothetical protein